MAPGVGIEPTTNWLTANCSAAELPRNVIIVTDWAQCTQLAENNQPHIHIDDTIFIDMTIDAFINEHPLGVLATVLAECQPHTSAMYFLPVREGEELFLYFVTDPSSKNCPTLKMNAEHPLALQMKETS